MNINQNGFEIIEEGVKTEILWVDIKEVLLQKNESEKIDRYSRYLSIHLINKATLSIPNSFSNWYKLLRSIPSSVLVNSSLDEYKAYLSKNLKSCRICGKVAVLNGICLSCARYEYNYEIANEYNSEAEYVKEEQLELFSSDSPIVLNHDLDDGFDKDPIWRPIVSKNEVLEYIKRDSLVT